MAEMEDKISAVLNNPQLMQQIMTMAQSLGQPSQQPEQAAPTPSNSMPDPPYKLESIRNA